jgi:hypothetical protein
MPGKSMHDFSGHRNRARERRFHFPVVSNDRKMPARFRAGSGCRMRDFQAAATWKRSIVMWSERGPDGQVSH